MSAHGMSEAGGMREAATIAAKTFYEGCGWAWDELHPDDQGDAADKFEPVVRAVLAAHPAPAADGLRIRKPQIHTGPKHMTVDEATSHYLRDAAARVRKQRYWGSGVTALVADLLDTVATAIDDQTTPEADPTAGEPPSCWCPNRHDGRRHNFMPGRGVGLCGDTPRAATPDADDASEPDAYRVSLDLATGSIDVTPAWSDDASTSAGEGLSGWDEVHAAVCRIGNWTCSAHQPDNWPPLVAAAATKARAEAGEQIAQAIEARRVPRLPSNSHDQVVTREALDFAARIARAVVGDE